MSDCIVFGGTGFIGSHVTEQLLAAGHRVTVPVRQGSDYRFLHNTQAKVQPLDFSDDNALRTIITGHSVVYNCLANPKTHNSPANMRQVEIDLTLRVLQAAAASGAQRFVQLSSIQAYGFDLPDQPVDESYPLKPYYAFNRICAEREQQVMREAEKLAIPLAVLRPVTVMGARDKDFAKVAIAHRYRVFVHMGRKLRFSGIDARDAGRAMVLLGHAPLAENPVYLVKGFDTSWQEVLQQLNRLRGRAALSIQLPASLANLLGRIGDAMPYRFNPPITRFSIAVLSTTMCFDDSKIRALGFSPQYCLNDALANYVN